ncbi:MAG: hypothetical protein AB7V46_12695 [Thermomicrobiales bacterium]
MRPALAWLFEKAEPDQITLAIRESSALASIRTQIESDLRTGQLSPIPPGERGDNLILALIALRLKFSRDVATEKLETNLALRRGSGSAGT